MENSNIIFKTENLEIFWQDEGNKSIKAKCTAKNPHDGQFYTKFAGWISKSLALHGSTNTQGYIYEKACELIAENSEEIILSVVTFLEKQEQVEIHSNGWQTKTIFASQLEGWEKANESNAGKGVNFKTSHPIGEGQRQKVRTMMQKNAPEGTNHL